MNDLNDEDISFEREGDEVPVRRFVAAYTSECPTCGNIISEGDPAGYIGDDNEASCNSCCVRV